MSFYKRTEKLANATFTDEFGEVEPIETASFEHGDFQLVGHGERTNAKCGKFVKTMACLEVANHHNSLDGCYYEGKIFRKAVFHTCHKPSCLICSKKGWAVREAHKIEVRLKAASRRFGQVEHVSLSVPPDLYGLKFDALRKKLQDALKVRGIIGGVHIFHGFRFKMKVGWYWNPPFHVLGFMLGGYGQCRSCPHNPERLRDWDSVCRSCTGFESRTRKEWFKDKWIAKVADFQNERKTIGGTAWYQLNHASIDVTKKRFRVAVWFGVCSYRRLKVTVKKRKELCQICGSELRKARYSGDKRQIWEAGLQNINSCLRRESIEDYIENGVVVWEYVDDEFEFKGYG